MSEQEHTSHEGEGFVAPDAPQRIEDLEKAEAMARESHGIRSRAAEARAEAASNRHDPNLKKSMKDEEIERASRSIEKTSQELDETADYIEENYKEFSK